MSTTGWLNETYTDFQTERSSVDSGTTSADFPSVKGPSLPLSFKIALLCFGALGTLTNGFVLSAISLSGQSKMNPSTVHIANHTTLERFNQSVGVSHEFLEWSK